MRKKKEKSDVPVYSKKNNKQNVQNKSHSKHSILHYHNNKLIDFETRKNKLKNDLEKQKNVEVINKMKQSIQEIENIENDYLLSTSNILIQYITLEDQEQNNNSCEQKTNTNDNYAKESIKELNKELNKEYEKDSKLYEIYKKKNQLTHEYMKAVDPNYIEPLSKNGYDISKDDIICKYCSCLLIIENGFSVCNQCGFSLKAFDVTEEPSYKEMQDYIYKPQFTYQKSSHLDDWLRRFQAKENRVVDQVILDKVILEAKKQRITDLNTLTEDKVKKFLKNLNLNEYYDNVIGIINRINGRPQFHLTPEIENKIKIMFEQIQEPFIKYKPATRKNFLSYSYILHQFFKILGLNEFTKYFPLLKSTDKLRQQDEIFRKIVDHMNKFDKSVNWVFYPTV